jgi:TPR repeat protein
MLKFSVLSLMATLAGTPLSYAGVTQTGDSEYSRAESALVQKNDIKGAIAAIEIAAKQGHPQATYRLANFYYRGTYVQENIPLAMHYFKTAADLGHAHANFLIGMHMLSGTQVKYDGKLIKHYIVRGAERGDADAQALLANFYENGELVKRDASYAWCWYELADRRIQSIQISLKTDQTNMQRERPDLWEDQTSQVSRLSNIAEMRSNLEKKMQNKQIVQARQCADGWQSTAP